MLLRTGLSGWPNIPSVCACCASGCWWNNLSSCYLHSATVFSPDSLSYQSPLRSMGRNAVMSFLLTDCVWEQHRERTDLDSLPAVCSLAWPCYPIPPLVPSFLSPFFSPSCNILLSVICLYKVSSAQTSAWKHNKARLLIEDLHTDETYGGKSQRFAFKKLIEIAILAICMCI